jgi:hypothetical protein
MRSPLASLALATSVAWMSACAPSSADGPSSPRSPGGDGGSLFEGGIGDGGRLDPDSGCLTTTSRSTLVPTTLLFQLDLSASMNCLPTEDAEANPQCVILAQPGSRWNLLRDALGTALGLLPQDDFVGLMHYPLYPENPSCIPPHPDVPPTPVSIGATSLRSALDALSPLGGTPTHDALAASFAELAPSSFIGNKYVVLATDGQANYCAGCVPSCDIAQDSLELIAQAEAALQQHGIRTFVIGVPGSEGFRAVLSRLAQAGGTARPSCHSGDVHTSPDVGDCHYDMTGAASDFGQAIGTALAAISGQALSCAFDIPAADAGTFDPGEVNVQFTDSGASAEIPRDVSQTDGWDYSPDGKHVVLYGTACEQVKQSKGGQIEIVYGCPTHGPR